MKPFPACEYLQCFVGDVIDQIRLGPFQVEFCFESMCRLVAEWRLEHTEPNGTVWAYNIQASEYPAIILHRLLRIRVAAIERSDLRLTLCFDEGSALSVDAELGPYESGHIETPEAGLIVF